MKYALEQTIFYIGDNKVRSAPILSRMVVENLHDDWSSNADQKELWLPFGSAKIVYNTCHGEVLESKAFASKEDLLNSL